MKEFFPKYVKKNPKKDNALKTKNTVFFCINEVTLSPDGGTTLIAFLSAEADEEGLTAIRNKNHLWWLLIAGGIEFALLLAD